VKKRSQHGHAALQAAVFVSESDKAMLAVKDQLAAAASKSSNTLFVCIVVSHCNGYGVSVQSVGIAEPRVQLSAAAA